LTHIEVKNNKMLFNSRNWFKFAALIFNIVDITNARYARAI